MENIARRSIFALFFSANLLILFFLKYSGMVAQTLAQTFPSYIHEKFSALGIAAPLGVSFYVFQSTTYLSDVYRKGLEPEKNFFRYVAFVSFFPVILSGPIPKARKLLPQLKRPAPFSSKLFIRGFLLFLYGYFEKVVVSNKLKVIVNLCWDDLEHCSGFRPILAVIAFSLYIYCDFSAYSDMACGISRMLGFHVKNNFKATPHKWKDQCFAAGFRRIARI